MWEMCLAIIYDIFGHLLTYMNSTKKYNRYF